MINKMRIMFRLHFGMILALLIIITAWSLPGQDIEPLTDLERQGLKGKVKSVLESRKSGFIPGENGSEGTVTYMKLSKYNEQGFETEVIIYNNNGKSSRVYFVFDTAGYPVGLNEYTDDGTLWLSVKYQVDKEGNKLQGDYEWLTKGGFDEIREKSELLYEVIDRHPWDKVIYTNDYRGFHLEESYRKNDGNELFKFAYRYNIHGNRSEMIYYNSKGRTSWETKFKYNRDHVLTESTVYKSNRIAARSAYTYSFDANGNWTRRHEKREVVYNILTTSLTGGDFLTERQFEYYP